MKPKIGKKSVANVAGSSVRLTPFEDSLHLATMLKISLDGRDVGGYILNKANKKDSFCFVFGFDCLGIHTTLRPEQIDTICNNIEAGLKDIPGGEKLTFHLGSFTSETGRQQELASLVREAASPNIKYL